MERSDEVYYEEILKLLEWGKAARKEWFRSKVQPCFREMVGVRKDTETNLHRYVGDIDPAWFDKLDSAIAKLANVDPRYRDCLVHHYVNRLPEKDAADDLGLKLWKYRTFKQVAIGMVYAQLFDLERKAL